MKKNLSIMLVITILFLSFGCSTNKNVNPLNPSKPVTVIVWHYYNGHIKENFDNLVNEFNETIGMEQGIVVDAQSLGDVQKIAAAVFDAANKTIGSQPMPDIFAAYPDNAFRVNLVTPLVNLETYFSQKELNAYYPAFLEEGRFPEDGLLRIIPIAKSSENLYLNKTYWEPFAEKNKLTEVNLETWEDLMATAKLYYNQTGNSFFSIDSNANFILTAAMQQEGELYQFKDRKVGLNFTPAFAEKIWNYFYVPYLNGYFAKTGRFSSDDAKTGTILAYTGSTAGAAYFPREISSGEQSIPVEVMTLPYPYFKDKKPVAIQQGAGMCISKSDAQHEYAAAQFLKWFTDPAQNLKFSASTGYLPTQTAALNKKVIMPVLEASVDDSSALKKVMTTTTDMLSAYEFYNNKPFKGSFEMRSLLETHLWQQIEKDLDTLNTRVANGENRASVIVDLTSNANFEQWYEAFISEASNILH